MNLQNVYRTGAVVALLAVSTVGALGQNQINASKTATGTETPINWANFAGAPNVNVNSALTFRELAQGKIGTEPSAYYAIPPWYQAYEASPLFPKVERFKKLAPYTDLGQSYAYGFGFAERALVDTTVSPPRNMSSSTYGSGVATTALNYAIKIQHSGAPISYFARIRSPKRTFTFQAAFSLCCSGDSNGGTYTYFKPKAARSRATADILADGLPIYSSEEIYLFPGAAAANASDKVESFWGNGKLDGSETIIFLGKLISGQVVNLNLIVRTDAFADAKTCGTEGGGFYQPTITRNCTKLIEALQLGEPADSETVPTIRIFGKSGL
ncbi:MAG: hypothetical protein NTV70_03695 [Acidobacteria bacterium]|nr:hypothetical protein [Acidobacteriota bacterium]